MQQLVVSHDHCTIMFSLQNIPFGDSDQRQFKGGHYKQMCRELITTDESEFSDDNI